MKNLFAYTLLDYFRYFAKLQLLKNRPVIVGITGSGGKTSTMHAVMAVLRDSFTTVESEKANSQSGLSLHILGITPKNFSVKDWLRMIALAPMKLLTNWQRFDVYIAEMGIDGPYKPANMEYLLQILKPKIGVFTSISSVHGQAFDKVVDATMALHGADATERETVMKQVIAKEKGRLLTQLPTGGTAIYNGDDPIIAAIGKSAPATKLSFGQKPRNDVVCNQVSWQPNATVFSVSSGGQSAQITIQGYWLPQHFANTFGAAIAVGLAMGIELEEGARRIQKRLVMPAGRATLIPAIHQATILDSSYNSSPASLADLLETVDSLPKTGSFPKRHLALLGDMRELGSLSEKSHTALAQKAAKTLDAVYLVGPAMQQYALPVLQKTKIPTFWFTSADEAAQKIKADLKKGDLLLVKGSQNTLLLEIAIQQLMAEPEKADQLLCRRGSYWEKERSKLIPQELRSVS